MATFAVGDIHGNSAALDVLLEQLRSEVTGDDMLVFLGDYIDRGPNSKQCVDTLIALGDQLPAVVIYLAGNHEDSFLKTGYDYRRHSWLLAMEAGSTRRWRPGCRGMAAAGDGWTDDRHRYDRPRRPDGHPPVRSADISECAIRRLTRADGDDSRVRRRAMKTTVPSR